MADLAKRELKRQTWLSVECPRCKAGPGQNCLRSDGKPSLVRFWHGERLKAARSSSQNTGVGRTDLPDLEK
jgi:hypothetical protein